LDLYLIWYFIIGFLLGNGVPHFVFGDGDSGRLAWLGLYDGYALGVLLLGFWLTMLMFGARIKRLLND